MRKHSPNIYARLLRLCGVKLAHCHNVGGDTLWQDNGNRWWPKKNRSLLTMFHLKWYKSLLPIIIPAESGFNLYNIYLTNPHRCKPFKMRDDGKPDCVHSLRQILKYTNWLKQTDEVPFWFNEFNSRSKLIASCKICMKRIILQQKKEKNEFTLSTFGCYINP